MRDILIAENISKSYDTDVFTGLSFSVSEKESLGIIGGNGRGKTTLLNIIAGLDRPSSGTLINNQKTGYVMQNGGLIERLSVDDNLKYYAELYGLSKTEAKQRIEYCIELCRLSGQLTKRVDKCSYGWKKRLSIALALLPSPKLLLLDEAGSGLDADSRRDFAAAVHSLKREGCSLIMVSHHNDEISEFCEKILDIETGKMYCVNSLHS